MSAVLDDIALSDEQIEKLTGYKLPSKQMEVLKRLGIRATKLRNNTIRVLKMDLKSRTLQQEQDAPKLKSSKK